MTSRSLRFAVLLAVLGFAAWSNLSYLGWGTPSARKDAQLFSSPQELESSIPRMLELRNSYYSSIQKMLDPSQPFQETYDRLFHGQEEVRPFSPLSRDYCLDRMRGYLIGAMNQEEQNTMSTLSKINPLKGRFSPGVYNFYGGLYYYTCGAFLAAGKVLGLVSLNPDVAYYFTHPDETRRMYALCRLVGALSALLCAVLLAAWMGRKYGFWTGWLAALFFVCMPLLIPQSHRAGAHSYSMFLFLLGYFFCWRFHERPERRNYLLAGFVLGLCAASIITNLVTGIAIFLTEWARNHWSLSGTLRSKNFYLACAVYFLVYLALDFYIFLNYPEFKRMILAMKEYMATYGETYGQLRLGNWLSFLADMFTNQMHWAILPALLAGLYRAATAKDSFLQVTAVLVLFFLLVNLAMTRHPGITERSFPLIAILCAQGVLLFWTGRPPAAKAAVAVYAALAVFLSGLQTVFYAALLREPSHLTQAGDWVNEHVPAGGSIGAVQGILPTMAFPPIRFLDYRMVFFPDAEQARTAAVEDSKLPDYVVTGVPDSFANQVLQARYRLEKRWDRPRGMLGIPFPSKWVATGDVDLYIFRKT